MAGNTVVLKPAQLTPWSGSELGRIVAEETDIPAGVFNVVVSNANEVGAALSADPRVDMITFTGSTATGRAILAAGASTVKKTLLELGGKSAHIVLDDADFNSALPDRSARFPPDDRTCGRRYGRPVRRIRHASARVECGGAGTPQARRAGRVGPWPRLHEHGRRLFTTRRQTSSR